MWLTSSCSSGRRGVERARSASAWAAADSDGATPESIIVQRWGSRENFVANKAGALPAAPQGDPGLDRFRSSGRRIRDHWSLGRTVALEARARWSCGGRATGCVRGRSPPACAESRCGATPDRRDRGATERCGRRFRNTSCRAAGRSRHQYSVPISGGARLRRLHSTSPPNPTSSDRAAERPSVSRHPVRAVDGFERSRRK